MSKHITIEVNDEGNKQALVLKAGASGDGALSVKCVYPSNPSGEVAPFTPSDKQVMALRDTHFRGYGILAMGEGGTQFRLFTPVERLSENQVKIAGKEFRYEVDSDKTLGAVSLFSTLTNSNKETLVTNTHLEDVLEFYLSHEDRILDCKHQFGNEAEFEYSVSGKAKRDRIAGYNM